MSNSDLRASKRTSFCLRFKTLADTVGRAEIHLRCLKQVADASDNYWDEMLNAEGFWLHTLYAHREACLRRLMLLTKQQKDSLTVFDFLEWVKNNRDVFSTPPTVSDIDKDLTCFKGFKPLIDDLNLWRDRSFMHLDKEEILHGGSKLAEVQIDAAKVKKFIDTVKDMLIRYRKAFDGVHFAPEIPASGNIEQAIFKPLERLRSPLGPETNALNDK